MSETLRLLKYDPAVALLIMANNHFNIILRPEFTSVGAPRPVSGSDTLTDVVITTHATTDPVIVQAYTGSMTYRYNRLAVNDVLGGLTLDLTPPLTVLGLLTNIAQASGLVLTSDDFDNALITTSSFELTAKASSLRWVGSTTVMLNEPGESVQLAEAFPNNVLDGLYPIDYSGATPLSTVVTDVRLDGLVYGPGSVTAS